MTMFDAMMWNKSTMNSNRMTKIIHIKI